MKLGYCEALVHKIIKGVIGKAYTNCKEPQGTAMGPYKHLKSLSELS
jgi:hypothetical protein